MDWLAYEKEILEELQSRYPGSAVSHNTKLPGRFSKVARQIDVLIEHTVCDSSVRIIVDTKHRKTRIDVKGVEAFLGLLADVGAEKGIMVSSRGYSRGAQRRAWNESAGAELDVYSLAEFKQLQTYAAIPYSGSAGAFLRAPFGWVVDAQRREGAVACLYQRGLDLSAAQLAREWMYVNFWHKDDVASDLDALCLLQNQDLIAAHPGARISYEAAVQRPDAPTRIRRAEVPDYPALEFTGFAEFRRFIFFAVLFTTPERQNVNLRKLRGLLREVQPLGIRHGRPA